MSLPFAVEAMAMGEGWAGISLDIWSCGLRP